MNGVKEMKALLDDVGAVTMCGTVLKTARRWIGPTTDKTVSAMLQNSTYV